MEQVARQIIDARMQPVVITTVPMSRSEVGVYLGSTQPRSLALLEAARTTSRSKLLPVIAVAAVLGIAIFGFTLGWLGVGVSLLISLVTAVGLGLALMALLTLVGGGGAPHCPGAWHR